VSVPVQEVVEGEGEGEGEEVAAEAGVAEVGAVAAEV
jgi:hypothetical protein